MNPALSVTVWRRGMAVPADLPTGQYTMIYRIPGPLAVPALAVAERMVGKSMDQNGGADKLTVTGYRVISRPFSPNVDFHFYCDCVGIAPLVAWLIVGAIAVSLGAVAIFTNATAVEIRKVLTTPAGQKYLGQAGGTSEVIAYGVLGLTVLAAVGGVIYAFGRRKAAA